MAQSRLTRWEDTFLPFNFTVEHLPGKEMGIVDYLPRHPSGDLVPVSFDDKKFMIASVNHISVLLSFENLMPKCSRSQTIDKFSQQLVKNKLTLQETEHEKRIENAAETLQTLVIHFIVSGCQNFQALTEDCSPSCQKIKFLLNSKL